MPSAERVVEQHSQQNGRQHERQDGQLTGIDVVLALPRWQQCVTLELTPALTAREAVLQAVAAGLDVQVAGLDPQEVPIGVFGEPVADDYRLQPGDRVELYRPLEVDPRERRRRRAAGQTDPR